MAHLRWSHGVHRGETSQANRSTIGKSASQSTSGFARWQRRAVRGNNANSGELWSMLGHAMFGAKHGTPVRLKSHPEVAGTYFCFTADRDKFPHMVEVPWSAYAVYVADHNLEIVPPEPFDARALQVGDVIVTKNSPLGFVIEAVPFWMGIGAIYAVWRHKPNADGTRGNYEIIYDAENGGAK